MLPLALLAGATACSSDEEATPAAEESTSTDEGAEDGADADEPTVAAGEPVDPAEFAERDDCVRGVEALTAVVTDLAVGQAT